MRSLRVLVAFVAFVAFVTLAGSACTRSAPTSERAGVPSAASAPGRSIAPVGAAPVGAGSAPAMLGGGAVAGGAASPAGAPGMAAAGASAAADAGAPTRERGPFELPFAKGRTVYFAVPPKPGGPRRLIANLHGMCNPPAYACGYWLNAGSERGFLVCPTGNASCGPGAFNAPTWTTGAPQMADDLDRAVATVEAAYPGEIAADGAILTGFSKGGFVAPAIAARRPGRFAYLLINEADVALDAASLRRSGVRAVALVAGEIGSQVAGERRTAARLAAQGFPARLWVMPKAGHHYSTNIDAIMAEALDWLVAQ